MFFKKLRKLIDLILKNKAKDLKYLRNGLCVALVKEGDEIIDAKLLKTKGDKRSLSKCQIRYFDILTSEEFFEEIPNERGLKLTNITIDPEAIRQINKRFPGTIKDVNKMYFSLEDIIKIEKKFLLLNIKK